MSSVSNLRWLATYTRLAPVSIKQYKAVRGSAILFVLIKYSFIQHIKSRCANPILFTSSCPQNKQELSNNRRSSNTKIRNLIPVKQILAN